MKKIYQAPQTYVYALMGQSQLLTESSIKVDSENKVDDESEIGFTKENVINDDDFWN